MKILSLPLGPLRPWLLSVLACGLISLDTSAHTRWNPDGLVKPRSTRDDLKTGPCGGIARKTPVVLQSGSTVTVQFESTIFHRGEFRISFSASGDTGFEQNVLANNILDVSGQRYRSHSITLPNVECEQCTLQLIQVMRDTNPPSNYFSCADIKLVKPAPPVDTTPPGDVTGLTAIPGDGQIVLNWMNPNDADLSQVLIGMHNHAFAFTPANGTQYKVGDYSTAVVFSGLANSFTLNNLTPGETYYFHLFAADRALNYSKGISTSVTVPAKVVNIAPMVRMDAEQNQNRITVVEPKNGTVLVQATVTDVNTDNKHHFDWTQSDNRLTNLSQFPEQFTFDPSALSPGLYEVKAIVTDDGMPPLSTETRLTLEVAKAPEEPKPTTRAGSLNIASALLMALFASIAIIRRRSKQLL